jgi:cobalt-zinc-cadmium efflux system outer membrane protein
MIKKRSFLSIVLIVPVLALAHTKKMTFNEAIDIAYKNSPLIKAQIAQIQKAQGTLTQSTLLPNPQVSAEFENISGSGAYNNFNSAETTFSIQQPIVLGGRLDAQGRANTKYVHVQQAQLEALKSNVYRQVGEAYINLLYGQRWIQVAKKLVHLNERIVLSITTRMRAGASSKVDLKLAQVALGESKITLSRARRKQAALQIQLVNLLNIRSKHPLIVSDSGVPHRVRSWKSILSKANESNFLAVQRVLIEANKSKIIADKKQAWPNLNAALGMRHFSATDDNALVASLSMNLPIFNYNQGTVKSSQSVYSKSIFDYRQAALKLNSELRTYYLDAVQNQEEAQIVTRDLLPTAKSAVHLARKGYAAGRYSYLQLANAMRMLLNEEKHFIDAHAKLDKAIINIKGLTLSTFRSTYVK